MNSGAGHQSYFAASVISLDILEVFGAQILRRVSVFTLQLKDLVKEKIGAQGKFVRLILNGKLLGMPVTYISFGGTY